MAEQYWIGGFHVDLSRNQISQNQQSQVLAPKALAVLTHLAENQGKVVSQDELLEEVWKDTIVSPNTLQRNIAQLRKALGDDGKGQVYIKTHAKQGYSLECDVRWQDQASEQSDNPQQNALSQALEQIDTSSNEHQNHQTTDSHQKAEPKLNKWPAFITFFVAIIALSGYWFMGTKNTINLSFGEIRPLTATDNKEFAGVYSPDGQYVVFNRYINLLCRNIIWAKNIETQEEFQLTAGVGSYAGHSFSKDGNSLVIIETQDCSKPITQKTCYRLMKMDFSQSLESPQSPTELMECRNSVIKNPQWLNNNNVALLQKSSGRWKLLSYSIEKDSSEVLRSMTSGNIIHYDYSKKDDVIALITVDKNERYYIEILSTDGKILSRSEIRYPKEIAKFKPIKPNFSPIEGNLIFSTGKQLFTLNKQGEISNIGVPLSETMGSPVFHPHENRLLAVKGHYDADLISMSLSQHQGQHKQPEYSVLERSTAGDYDAIKQPNGELLAFNSGRSGEEQIWLSNGSSARQITKFSKDTFINGMAWASDGKSLLVNVNYQLLKVNLDGNTEEYPIPNSIILLYQWDSESNEALALMRDDGLATFTLINLNQLETTTIHNRQVNWAMKTEDGRIIYTDSLDQFWIQGAIEDKLLEALNGQGSDKRFLVKKNTIYGINKESELWSYTLDKNQFNIMGKTPVNLDHITDMDKTSLYGVIRTAAKKELAELFLK